MATASTETSLKALVQSAVADLQRLIKAQVRLPRRAIGAVTRKAVLGQNRQDVTVVLQLVLALSQRPEPDQGQ